MISVYFPDSYVQEWCLLKGNQYLAYATCKCVLSSVTADAIRAEELRNFLEKLVQELGSVEDRHAEGETSWRAASILDLFQHLFGSTTEEVKRICVDSLQEHWISLTSRFLQPPDSQISPVALFAFLSLWKKVLNVPVAAAWCVEEDRKATSILLQYVTCAKTKGYVRLKTVGLLNKLMAFEMEDRRDKSDGRFYSYEIADQVVDWIQAGRLSEAVCREGSAVFGWTLTDHAPQHTYSTDILFRRKLALLCLRTISFTLAKHRNEEYIREA
ncbi:uncharacterized protein LOC135473306 [Liolophura sinensis]|uniref:uncharacterized protein LOC135473306 n=1 Tax=Liolophura sinensis TaxID=3198878 RepID=UPI0031593A7E